MTGHNHSNQLKKQAGQVLLIIVMILATVLTVVLSISFKAATDTQITKLEEESQKTLAAAEAGIEEALRTKQPPGSSILIESISSLSGSGFSGTATTVVISDTDFISPLLQKDDQYTFYLADYDPANTTFGSSFTGPITIYYGSSGANCANLALEMTLVYGAANSIERWIADTGNLLNGSGSPGNVGSNSGGTYKNTISFNCKATLPTIPGGIYANPKLLFVRVFGSSTRLWFNSTNPFKPQGVTINSQASSTGGVTKRVSLFQSYPQIPSAFFVSSF